jgi:transposase-like protein
MVVKIGGRRMYLWRAVDDEGEVLDVLVHKRRNKHAALKLLRKLLKNQGMQPETIVTDKLASYRAAMRVLGLSSRHRPGGMRENNRAENSHLVIRRRERKQEKFNPRAPPNGSSPATLRSTTPSILSSTSFADPAFASSGRRPIGPGRWRPRLPDIGSQRRASAACPGNASKPFQAPNVRNRTYYVGFNMQPRI